jgi:hypothetical protein
MRVAHLAPSQRLDSACHSYRLENCAPWKASLPDVVGGQLTLINTAPPKLAGIHQRMSELINLSLNG